MKSVFLVTILLLLCLTDSGFGQKCGQVDDNHRFDCHPEEGASQQKCEARGCCWGAARQKSRRANNSMPDDKKDPAAAPKLDVPYCYYPLDFPGYVSGVPAVIVTSYGLTGNLSRNTKSYYPKDIMDLRMDVYFETDSRLRIKIFDPNNARYEVPIDTPPFTTKPANPLYEVQWVEPVGLVIIRKSTKHVVFNTTINPGFIYSDQFIQISSCLSSSYVYGLGEHRSSLVLPTDWQRFTFWARDQPPVPNSNLYGNHAFYINQEPDGNTHAVFLLNSNAMDVILQPAPAITYRTIGGILDFYVFLGPDPIDVVRHYQGVIGHPFMPPMWGLGFHLCRWGYGSANGTMEVVDRMRKAGIPQDAQWNDIDYMNQHRDWTLDPAKYATASNVVENLHSNGQHYVPIVDPAICSSQQAGSYPPFDTGITDNIFTKAEDGSVFVGQVWPGDTAFPDWFHPNTTRWWQTLAQKFHGTVNFDGMWLDMNEPSNFRDGGKNGCSSSSTLNNPPYVPGVAGGTLYSRTVCPAAQQYAGSHYDLHNLYGLSEVKISYTTLANIRKKRPFIISRSTFASSGRYAGHWLGDNRSEWPEMHYSITGILTFSMFGIPLVGADICGFSGDTTEELCTRWMQLGAFYPFSRNHNTLGSKDQDPAVFSEASQSSSKEALLMRYSLLPYLYTLFHAAHANATMVARPLFFDFPGLPSLYTIDTQFMLGEAVMVSPVLTKGATTVNATFPPSRWYDNYGAVPLTFTEPTSVILDAPLDKINVHLRGGFVIPAVIPATTVTEIRKNPVMLLICLDAKGTAKGEMFWDDGESMGTFENGEFIALNFTAANNMATSTVEYDGYSGSSEMQLSGGVVEGAATQPSNVTVNGQTCHFEYQQQYQKLSFTCTTLVPFNKPVTIRWG